MEEHATLTAALVEEDDAAVRSLGAVSNVARRSSLGMETAIPLAGCRHAFARLIASGIADAKVRRFGDRGLSTSSNRLSTARVEQGTTFLQLWPCSYVETAYARGPHAAAHTSDWIAEHSAGGEPLPAMLLLHPADKLECSVRAPHTLGMSGRTDGANGFDPAEDASAFAGVVAAVRRLESMASIERSVRFSRSWNAAASLDVPSMARRSTAALLLQSVAVNGDNASASDAGVLSGEPMPAMKANGYLGTGVFIPSLTWNRASPPDLSSNTGAASASTTDTAPYAVVAARSLRSEASKVSGHCLEVIPSALMSTIPARMGEKHASRPPAPMRQLPGWPSESGLYSSSDVYRVGATRRHQHLDGQQEVVSP